MRMFIEKGICIGLILFAFSFLTGCAKDVGEDNVPKIAATIKVSMSTLVDEGLRLLEKEAPEQVPPTMDDLNAVVAQIVLYNDGTVSVGDVTKTLTDMLTRLNVRFMFVENDNAALLLRTIANLAKLVEIYFVEAKIPADAVVYANAVMDGIKEGIASYQGQ